MTNKDLEDVAAGNDSSVVVVREKSTVKLEEIFEYLSQNSKIIFKSQQIDDPELSIDEKKSIAKEVFAKNPKTFIMRFGQYLNVKHVEFFEELENIPIEDQDEFNYLLDDLHVKLEKRKSCVKNRRYTATQKMHEYFSETEMMKREPHLYHELVGQYLSEEERTQRDTYDVRNTTFSGILLNKMDRDNAEEVLQKQQEDEDDDDDTPLSREESSDEEEEYASPSYRQQWGNFDDENIPCTSSKVIKKQKKAKKKVKQQKFITAGERDILKQEFIGIMKAKFLNGEDKEFNYDEVDDNAELDDLNQLNQDKEDEYFGESSEDENCIERMDDEDDNERPEEESDDDLDVYMTHLNQHHSLKTNSLIQ
ncbi:coiled-coil domain-containing protein 97 [Episyrphus balteatus]|uniref:coiled-coil domain-containing protein 97 n=1 Tax=Episyrphus balteatus TaxID=286459 RepID=UPI00248530EF|nr:coiled-coil domain-containing protein 97 [Episyrphus balteatus]